MSTFTNKRLYRIVVGFETLFAMDEFDTPEEILDRHLDEIIKSLDKVECCGIFEETEIETMKDLDDSALLETWSLDVGTPFSRDDDPKTLKEYFNQISDPTKQLLGCPFCGETDHAFFDLNNKGDEFLPDDLLAQIQCFSCGARSPEGNLNEVIERWNLLFSATNSSIT